MRDLGFRYRALASSGHEAVAESLRGYHLVDVDEAGIRAATRALSASPAVALVERVPNRWLCARPSDPLLNRQWGLRAIRWFQRKSARRLPGMKKKSFTSAYGHGLIDVARALT